MWPNKGDHTHLLCDESELDDAGEDLEELVGTLAGLLPRGLGFMSPASTPALLSFTLCCLAVDDSDFDEEDLELSLKIVCGGGEGTSLSKSASFGGDWAAGFSSVFSPDECLCLFFFFSFSVRIEHSE